MTDKLRLGILFGGRSCEHEVSVTSARSVLQAVNPDRYEVTMIGIAKDGRWLLARDALEALAGGVVDGEDMSSVLLDYPGTRALVESTPSGALTAGGHKLDVVFPLLHGPFGEDGTVQGLLELAGIAYVGSGVVGSAVGMDKDMSKRVFRAEGLPQVDHRVLRRHRWRVEPDAIVGELERGLHYPMFVKPANLGSSVGVSKAHDRGELYPAIETAMEFDYKVIVEASVENCREVECSVLGNDDPQASVIGEIVPCNEFYDYDAKYVDDRSRLIIPAELPAAMGERIRDLAVRAFRAVEAAGLARVDFLVRRDDDEIFLNEVNTMPGFTPISMYPKLWEASGITYTELIDRLIELALERHAEKARTRAAL